MHTDDLIPNMMKGVCSGTTYVSLSISLLFSIMKCDNAMSVVYAELYPLLELDWETGPVTCVQ